MKIRPIRREFGEKGKDKIEDSSKEEVRNNKS